MHGSHRCFTVFESFHAFIYKSSLFQLRSSFSKAFGKNKSSKSPAKANGSVSDAEECTASALARRIPSGDSSYPNSPVHQAKRNSNASGQLKPAGSLSG